MKINQFELLAKSRVSHRRFLSDPVPIDDIKKMVEIAADAPSGYNYQPWKFTGITSQEVKKQMVDAIEAKLDKIKKALPDDLAVKLSKFSFFITHFQSAPAVIAVSHTRTDNLTKTFRKNSNGVMNVPENFDMELLAVGGAIEQLILAATAMDYATCWLTTPINYAQKELEEILHIKEPFNLVSLVAVGKPKKSELSPEKKALDEILTFK